MDIDAVKRLVAKWDEKHRPAVRYRIHGIINGRKEEVEDLTQEVFKNALRYLLGPASHPINHPQKWLLKIADNVCYNHLNKNSHFSISSYDTEQFLRDNLPDNENNQPEIRLFGKDPELMEAMEGLSFEERRAVYLHYAQNMTYEQISVVTGRSPEKEGRDARSGLEKLRRSYLHAKETQ